MASKNVGAMAFATGGISETIRRVATTSESEIKDIKTSVRSEVRHSLGYVFGF